MVGIFMAQYEIIMSRRDDMYPILPLPHLWNITQTCMGYVSWYLNIPLQRDDYWMILYMSWTCMYDLGS